MAQSALRSCPTNVVWATKTTASARRRCSSRQTASVLLALKLLLAPTLVVLSSLATRRWGPRLGGILVTIPIVAGPILLIICLEHGPAFAAQAAAASTLANVALAVFALALIMTVDRVPWWVAMMIAWALVVLTDLGLAAVTVPAWLALLVAVLALHGVQYVLRRQPDDLLTATRLPWWDLPARAMATAALVLTVTWSAEVAGPNLSGVLAPFPIALSVVCAFAAAQHGRTGVIGLLRGIVPGLDGFALFCFVLAVTLNRLPVWMAFTLATILSLAWALALIRWGERKGGGTGHAPRTVHYEA